MLSQIFKLHYLVDCTCLWDCLKSMGFPSKPLCVYVAICRQCYTFVRIKFAVLDSCTDFMLFSLLGHTFWHSLPLVGYQPPDDPFLGRNYPLSVCRKIRKSPKGFHNVQELEELNIFAEHISTPLHFLGCENGLLRITLNLLWVFKILDNCEYFWKIRALENYKHPNKEFETNKQTYAQTEKYR